MAIEKLPAEMREAAPLEIVLAREVGVEGRPADIGAFANVFDRDRLLAFLQYQGEQRLVQHSSGAHDTAVDRFFATSRFHGEIAVFVR
jgi:nucleotidyltransferase/DNA polymerase involved in DNA repair